MNSSINTLLSSFGLFAWNSDSKPSYSAQYIVTFSGNVAVGSVVVVCLGDCLFSTHERKVSAGKRVNIFLSFFGIIIIFSPNRLFHIVGLVAICPNIQFKPTKLPLIWGQVLLTCNLCDPILYKLLYCTC